MRGLPHLTTTTGWHTFTRCGSGPTGIPDRVSSNARWCPPFGGAGQAVASRLDQSTTYIEVLINEVWTAMTRSGQNAA